MPISPEFDYSVDKGSKNQKSQGQSGEADEPGLLLEVLLLCSKIEEEGGPAQPPGEVVGCLHHQLQDNTPHTEGSRQQKSCQQNQAIRQS